MKHCMQSLNVIMLIFLLGSFMSSYAKLVEIITIDPTIIIDLKYATKDNFTHHVVYDSPRCFLEESAARALNKVQKELRKHGCGLKIWDGYRPLSAQKKFWALVPDENYVANPAKGSRHNRGCAVDLTLISLADNSELAMQNLIISPQKHIATLINFQKKFEKMLSFLKLK